ncbi:sulfatase-like hydrolase/transferase [Pontiella agarivorans]|uniref:Sulfatase-like hydrolase/transferase n=1 Tax=Pontiella agarivorans TaxID=3038953 RepID=A0ABU5MW26_9BACT|nr:sulfatase-like hydrolase/transferase [Pontiella agarivorans]MDZ8118431.1 sulfatase-like hydrolase/transferase [Pontiella agarivorans]
MKIQHKQNLPIPSHSVYWTLVIAAVLTFLSILTCFSETRPNVIILFADDISPRELPVYQSSVWTKPKGGDTSDPKYRAHTPVLDRLASEGCYLNSVWGATVCMPSRAMMMTGRYATRTKWWDNRDLGKIRTPKGERTWYLFESSPIGMGQIALMGGYASVWAGKTQMQVQGEDFQRFGFTEGMIGTGDEMDIRNFKYGFRTTIVNVDGKPAVKNLDSGKLAPGYPLARRSYGFNPHQVVVNEKGKKAGLEWWPNTPEAQASFSLNTYGPDIETDYGLDFMERQHKAGKPFLIYHATHLGHGDFDWLNPDSGNKWPGTPVIQWDGKRYHRTEPDITGSKGVYDTHGTVTDPGLHRHINYCDYIMWRYIEKTKALGIYENTVFIFAADNGSHKFGKTRVDQQRGVHVPLIIHASNLTKKGELNALASLVDMVPTLADIMGVKIPENYELDGKSLWPYLTADAPEPHDWIYSYKKDKQLARGRKVLRDGYGTWWDVSVLPEDHCSFPEIKDWGSVSEQHREEREMLLKVLEKNNIYETEYNAPR